jgi:DNA-binding GntR family transcriptional regulator
MFVVKFTSADVDELYALRTMYELFALRYTLAHGRPMPMEVLEDLVADMTGSAQSDEGAIRAAVADMAFHTVLISACGLKRLIAAWVELTPQLQMLFHRRKAVGADFSNLVEPSHRDLLIALRTCDGEGAERALRAHIDGSYQALIAHWDEDFAAEGIAVGGPVHG